MDKPAEILELEIVDLARGGAGVAKESSGRVIFVPLTMPGDRVKVQVTEAAKRFAQAEVLELIRPSPDRVAAPCPYFGYGPDKCGGCEWQHIPYAIQWRTKLVGVRQALERARVATAGLPFVEFPAPEGERFHYRNRVQLRGEGARLGFLARASKRLVPVETCAIARPELNAKLPDLRVEGAKLPAPYQVELEVLEDGQVPAHWNRGHAAGGFRQVHDAQNMRLQAWVAERVPEGARVLDLYGGSGNLSLGLAARVREIHCVDTGRARIDRYPANFRLERSDVGRWLAKFPRPTDQVPTIAILDPPRDGLADGNAAIADNLARIGVTRILAVGCDADSWARDVSRFIQQGWRLAEAGALDFFPQTSHVEALAVLDLASG